MSAAIRRTDASFMCPPSCQQVKTFILAYASPLGPDRCIWLFPDVSLKGRLERRLGDTAGVVRDRGRGNDGNDLERMVFAETSRNESVDLLVIETSTFFDHCLCQ